MKKKSQDRPRRIRTTEDEVDVLVALRGTVSWAIMRRVSQRFLTNLTRVAFNLPESDPNFAVRHASITGQAIGVKQLIRFVEKLKPEEDK